MTDGLLSFCGYCADDEERQEKALLFAGFSINRGSIYSSPLDNLIAYLWEKSYNT